MELMKEQQRERQGPGSPWREIEVSVSGVQSFGFYVEAYSCSIDFTQSFRSTLGILSQEPG